MHICKDLSFKDLFQVIIRKFNNLKICGFFIKSFYLFLEVPINEFE